MEKLKAWVKMKTKGKLGERLISFPFPVCNFTEEAKTINFLLKK